MTDRPITLSVTQFAAVFAYAALAPAPARADFLRTVIASLSGADPCLADEIVEATCRRALNGHAAGKPVARLALDRILVAGDDPRLPADPAQGEIAGKGRFMQDPNVARHKRHYGRLQEGI